MESKISPTCRKLRSSGSYQGLGSGGNGEILVRGWKLLVIRFIGYGNLMYGMVIMANNTVSYILESCQENRS